MKTTLAKLTLIFVIFVGLHAFADQQPSAVEAPPIWTKLSNADSSFQSGTRWTLYVSQNPSPPFLKMKLIDGGKVMIYWPSRSKGYELVMNTDPATPKWKTPPEKVADDDTFKSIIVTPSGGDRYYALKKP